MAFNPDIGVLTNVEQVYEANYNQSNSCVMPNDHTTRHMHHACFTSHLAINKRLAN